MLLGKQNGGTNASQKPASAASVTKPAYTLPTEVTEPVETLAGLSIFMYGEKKIGKSSVCAEFPKPIFAAFEKGYQGLSIVKEDMFDAKGVVDWKRFVAFVDAIVAGNHDRENVIIDTVDICYDACLAWWCKDNGVAHPSELSFGKGFDGVKKEFAKQIGKLTSTGLGVVFISHCQEKEVKERTYGTYDKMMPTVSGQGGKLIQGIASLIIYFGYHGNERMMTINGSESVVSGNRLSATNFFVKGGYEKYLQYRKEVKELKLEDKYTKELEADYRAKMEEVRVHSIPAGIDAEDAYFNLEFAFNNRQLSTGKPDAKYVPALSDQLVPMGQGKKK